MAEAGKGHQDQDVEGTTQESSGDKVKEHLFPEVRLDEETSEAPSIIDSNKGAEGLALEFNETPSQDDQVEVPAFFEVSRNQTVSHETAEDVEEALEDGEKMEEVIDDEPTDFQEPVTNVDHECSFKSMCDEPVAEEPVEIMGDENDEETSSSSSDKSLNTRQTSSGHMLSFLWNGNPFATASSEKLNDKKSELKTSSSCPNCTCKCTCEPKPVKVVAVKAAPRLTECQILEQVIKDCCSKSGQLIVSDARVKEALSKTVPPEPKKGCAVKPVKQEPKCDDKKAACPTIKKACACSKLEKDCRKEKRVSGSSTPSCDKFCKECCSLPDGMKIAGAKDLCSQPPKKIMAPIDACKTSGPCKITSIASGVRQEEPSNNGVFQKWWNGTDKTTDSHKKVPTEDIHCPKKTTSILTAQKSSSDYVCTVCKKSDSVVTGPTLQAKKGGGWWPFSREGKRDRTDWSDPDLKYLDTSVIIMQKAEGNRPAVALVKQCKKGPRASLREVSELVACISNEDNEFHTKAERGSALMGKEKRMERLMESDLAPGYTGKVDNASDDDDTDDDGIDDVSDKRQFASDENMMDDKLFRAQSPAVVPVKPKENKHVKMFAADETCLDSTDLEDVVFPTTKPQEATAQRDPVSPDVGNPFDFDLEPPRRSRSAPPRSLSPVFFDGNRDGSPSPCGGSFPSLTPRLLQRASLSLKRVADRRSNTNQEGPSRSGYDSSSEVVERDENGRRRLVVSPSVPSRIKMLLNSTSTKQYVPRVQVRSRHPSPASCCGETVGTIQGNNLPIINIHQTSVKRIVQKTQGFTRSDPSVSNVRKGTVQYATRELMNKDNSKKVDLLKKRYDEDKDAV